MTNRQPDLDTWRRLDGPHSADTHRAAQLREALVAATPVEPGTLAATFRDRAIDGDTHTAFELACSLRSEGDHRVNLAHGWLGYAALAGHRGARPLLARILLAEAADLELGRMDGTIEGHPHAQNVLTRIWRAVEISDGTIEGARICADYRRYLAGAISASGMLESARDEAEPLDALFLRGSARSIQTPLNKRSYSVPTVAERTVVPEIGDPQGADGRRIARTYKRLTEPLPLKPVALTGTTIGDLLVRDYPWMTAVIDAIVDDIRLQALAGRPWLHVQPTILVGPPGCGKTAFCRGLARLGATGFGAIDAGGSTDNRMLAGTARGWASAQPAYPLQLMLQTGSANPLILVDEIDKGCSGGHNGNLSGSLLGMIEPGTAQAWLDECLMAPADLSAVSWLLTANDIRPVPRPLRSRCRTISVPAPGARHAETVLAGLERDLRDELGLPSGSDLPVIAEARRALLAHLRRGGEIRKVKAALRRCVARATERTVAQ